MKLRARIALITLTLLAAVPALTGCSDTTTPASPELAKSETQAESEAIPKSERGNIVKQVGELAELKDADGNLLASFTVNNIAVNPECDGPAENGALVGLDVSIETTPDYEAGSILWGPWGWKIIDSDGVTFNDLPLAVANCYPTGEMLAGEVGPGEKRLGKLVLDVPTESGVLVFNDMWEWEYPAA